MEEWFKSTNERVQSLEEQNATLKENVQEKEQVVVINTQERDEVIKEKSAVEEQVRGDQGKRKCHQI